MKLGVSGRTARTIRIFSLEVSPDLVLLNIRKLDFHDFRYFLKVTSSQNTFKWAPNEASRVPSHGIPWAPKGSPPMGGPGPPPMGSLGLPRVPSPMGPLPWDPFGLPRVPSHGIPPHLPLNFCPSGQNINYKRITQRLFSKVSLGHGLARPWPGPGQARPGNIFLEMMVNELIADECID